MSFGGIGFADFAKDVLFRVSDNEMMEEDRNQRQGYEAAQASINRDYMQRNMDTTYQRGVTDLKAAGLNPMLALSRQAPSSASGAQGSGAGGTRPAGGHTSVASAAAGAASLAQVELIGAQTDKTRAETEAIREQPEKIRAETEKLKQEVKQSVAEVERIVATTGREVATAANLEQQTTNLKEVVPQIRATVTLLRAQTQQSLQSAGLSEQQAKEVHQRIQANLPDMQRILTELEAKLRALAVPGAQSQAMAADSFAGVLGSYLRAVIPINNLLNLAR